MSKSFTYRHGHFQLSKFGFDIGLIISLIIVSDIKSRESFTRDSQTLEFSLVIRCRAVLESTQDIPWTLTSNIGCHQEGQPRYAAVNHLNHYRLDEYSFVHTM